MAEEVHTIKQGCFSLFKQSEYTVLIIEERNAICLSTGRICLAYHQKLAVLIYYLCKGTVPYFQ